MPRLGLRGILRLTLFKDVFIASGNGVGGGSLGYANTLYRPRPAFFADRQWDGLAEWESELGPHYDMAERMLGVANYEGMTPADELLREYGEEIGVGETFKHTRVGIFFGPAGEQVADPYFGGEGPERTGCLRCGSCMVGCRYGAKNTLVKNYLWFAEKLGATVIPERQVTEIRPLGPGDGSEGYELTTEHPGAWVRKRRRTLRARGVVVAAGALGTNQLLAECKHDGSLPRISDRLGEVVRTNTESVQAVTTRDDSKDFTRSVAITSSIYPDPDTHIEVVTYGRGGDALSGLFTMFTGPGTRATRPLRWIAADRCVTRSRRCASSGRPRWSRRTVILLVMQTLDTAMSLRATPRRRGGVKLQTEQDPERPNPTLHPRGRRRHEVVRRAHRGHRPVRHHRGDAEHADDRPHPGRGRHGGRRRNRRRRHAQPGLRLREPAVCDGSAVPANPGVNPSLTITALAERAMSFIPPADESLRELPETARAAS